MDVLLIIDMTKDFCKGGPLAVPEADDAIPVINELLESKKFKLKVATKDAHSADHVSFAKNHPGCQVFQTIKIPGGEQTLYPDHGIKGTPGAEFHPDLKAHLLDLVIEKGSNPNIDSYSAFYDNQKKYETNLRETLDAHLAQQGKKRSDLKLYVCGVCTEICDFCTVLHGCELGFDVHFIVDASRALNINPGDEMKALKAMAAAGAKLIYSRDILVARERAPFERDLTREVGLQA